MLTRNNVIKTISKLPESFSIDELVDRMILLDKIEKGIQDANNGDVISETELDKLIRNTYNPSRFNKFYLTKYTMNIT